MFYFTNPFVPLYIHISSDHEKLVAKRVEQYFMLLQTKFAYYQNYPEIFLTLMGGPLRSTLSSQPEEEDDDVTSEYEFLDDQEEVVEHKKAKEKNQNKEVTAKTEQKKALSNRQYTFNLYSSLLEGKWAYHVETTEFYKWENTSWSVKPFHLFLADFEAVNLNTACKFIFLASKAERLYPAIHARVLIAKDAIRFSELTVPVGINFQNGYFDAKTLQLIENRFKYPIQDTCQAAFARSLPSEAMLFKLNSLVNGDTTSLFALRTLLYRALIPTNACHSIYAIVGQPDSAKSVFLRVLIDLVGASKCFTPRMRELQGNFGTAEYIHKNLVVINEASSISHEAETSLKASSGRDFQSTEIKGVQKRGQGVFNGVIVMASNLTVTELSNVSSAMRSRMIPINFERKCARDKHLEAFFKSNASELMWWALTIPQAHIDMVIRADLFAGGKSATSTAIGRFMCETCVLR